MEETSVDVCSLVYLPGCCDQSKRPFMLTPCCVITKELFTNTSGSLPKTLRVGQDRVHYTVFYRIFGNFPAKNTVYI